MSKWVKISVAFFAAIALVLALGAVYVGVRIVSAPIQVRREIARIEAAGQPTSPADLAGPKIPDAENAGVIYAKVAKKLSEPKHRNDMDLIADFLSPGPPRTNFTPPSLEQVRPVIARYSDIMPVLETATTRPKCRYLVDWSAGWNSDIPQHAGVRSLSRLLSALAIVDAQDGKMDDAVRSVISSIRLAESLKDEPGLISQLLRMAVANITTRSTFKVLKYHPVNSAQAKALFDAFGLVNLVPGFITGMKGERALAIGAYATFPSLGGETDTSPSDRGTRNAQRRNPIMSVLLSKDEIFYLQQMRQFIDSGPLTYGQLKRKRPDLIVEPAAPRLGLLSMIFLPLGGRAFAARDRATAEVGGIRIVLALQAYRDKLGAYPENLAKLRSGLGWKLPPDPFSGEDFKYRKYGQGFLLYSIGEDIKDNGGTTYASPKPPRRSATGQLLPPSGPPKQSTVESGDIVWKMDR